jgi:hypothetical protein
MFEPGNRFPWDITVIFKTHIIFSGMRLQVNVLAGVWGRGCILPRIATSSMDEDDRSDSYLHRFIRGEKAFGI